MQVTIEFKQTGKMSNSETNSNSELFIIIILIKLTILCVLKIMKLCTQVYKKHNEVVLKNNLTKFIDIENGKNNIQPKSSTSGNVN